ncbi:branched-chain amino acid transport system II carrier protein [Varibaculum cambriense]|uniref:branched-chain amino acid transport system II carrier protein n=1 Tax=Varibaculum cambriense TaxID=184870 RepID=UPI002555DC75|nr:branched-chain amino acid transport system II carrier protein [Varibaculum cambriense]MDK8274619.1 branched-chain amino acid transport system II carrier protein [Varibaculum cambriense]
MNSKTRVLNVLVTGLALFAMFFGAGNLIFPVMIGVESGVEQVPATIGFMLTGVLLPMAGMIAAATSSSGVLGIIERMSHYPGLVFCWLIFLSTGMLYAIPRTAAASFSMSFQASTGYSHLALFIYTLVFFGIAGYLCLNPRNVLDRIGGILTPALLILLAVIIITAVATMSPSEAAPIEKYASTPTLKGIFDGYGTLDAIASFVFGVVIIRALRQKGFQPGRQLFGVTALSGVIAAFFLGLVYFGLSMVGSRVGRLNPDVKDGGEGLAFAAQHLFGPAGRVVLGAIAILACLTTAIGLVEASTQFFRGLFPQISRPVWVVLHVIISLAIANLGLEALVNVIVPVMMFCYPITIMLVVTCILDIFIPGHMFWAYRLSVWVAGIFGLFDGLKAAGVLENWIDTTIPLASLGLGWLIPSLVMLVLGLIIDIAQGRMKQAYDYDAVARERNQSLVSAGLAFNEDELDEVAKPQENATEKSDSDN